MTAVSWYPNRQSRRNLGGRFRAPPEFGRSVNPIPTMGADYAHQITPCPSYGPVLD